MAILVVNAGSTTIKYKLFSNDLTEILSGVLDKTDNDVESTLKKNGSKYKWVVNQEAFQNPASTILNEVKEHQLDFIAFRVVHGGEDFREPQLISTEVLEKLEKLNNLAPLHNPPAIRVIRDFISSINLPMYAVFDTAYHATMPPESYLYSIPFEFYSKHKIRKYGFHGTSHKYVHNRIKSLEKRSSKIVSCHLGGGASITAIDNGIVMDTSMGFTPLEGLTMATRSGDIDAGVVMYMARELKIPIEEINEILNKKSGLLGISGMTSDMRVLLQEEAAGNERAYQAIETYIYDVRRYIGSYIALLGGIDVLAFTAGIGQGSDVIRTRVCANLENFGIILDETINTGKINVSEDLKISLPASVPVWVIATNEEWQIATEARDFFSSR